MDNKVVSLTELRERKAQLEREQDDARYLLMLKEAVDSLGVVCPKLNEEVAKIVKKGTQKGVRKS